MQLSDFCWGFFLVCEWLATHHVRGNVIDEWNAQTDFDWVLNEECCLGVGVGQFRLYKRSEWASARTSLVGWSLGGRSDANPTHLNTPLDRKMTTAMMKGFVLFVCLFFTVVQSIACEANIDARRKHENDVAHHRSAITTGNIFYLNWNE